MEDLAHHWREQGQGFVLKDFDGNTEGMISHAVWADNIWLVSSRLDSVTDMFEKLTSAFDNIGFQWKESSLQIMATPGALLRSYVEVGPPLQRTRIPVVHNMACLGSVLPRDGGTEEA
eukprot:707313-Lingulodinium_polyedra.AAC.1